MTYRYQKFFILFGGIGTGIGKNCYRKKVLEPVSEKVGTGTEFCRPNFGILKIYTGTVWVQVSGFSFFCGGMGTGIGKIRYRKTFSEPVSVKFGIGTGITNISYRKKVPVLVSLNILGSVTHCDAH